MKDITPDTLKETVERLSKKYNFPVKDVFAGKDDYSLPETEKLGLVRRNEILIGCNFYNKSHSKKIRLEYRIFDGSKKNFVASIDGAFEEERKIIENELSKVGIAFQTDNPSIEYIEKFLSIYFQAQPKINEYFRKKEKLERKKRELEMLYQISKLM